MAHMVVCTARVPSCATWAGRLSAGPRHIRPTLSRYIFVNATSQKVKQSTKTKSPKVVKPKKLRSQATPPPDASLPTWGFLELPRYSHTWPVTWGLGAVAAGMTAWAASFIGLGLFIIPKLFIAMGVNLRDGGPGVQATFILTCQAAQTLVGVGIITGVVEYGRARAAQDGSPLTSADADGLLQFSWEGPFKKPMGWAAWALSGIALSPLVVGSTALLLEGLGYEKLVSGGRGTIDSVLPVLQPDYVSFASLLATAGVLAPIMEETVFRGFLLPSLSRYMPTWTAVLVTAGFFGVAHLSLRDLPVLFTLGTLLGFMYVRSRNLLTPIIIHGTWNSLVLVVLFYLSVHGVDVQQLLREASAS